MIQKLYWIASAFPSLAMTRRGEEKTSAANHFHNESPDFLEGEEISFVEGDDDYQNAAASKDEDDEDDEDIQDAVAEEEVAFQDDDEE